MRIQVTITGEYEADPTDYPDQNPQKMVELDFEQDPAWFLCEVVEGLKIYAVEDARA